MYILGGIISAVRKFLLLHRLVEFYVQGQPREGLSLPCGVQVRVQIIIRKKLAESYDYAHFRLVASVGVVVIFFAQYTLSKTPEKDPRYVL